MTARFKDEIIPWLFKWEGTYYEDDKDDPGGATKFGIDQRSHPHVDIRNLTAEQRSTTTFIVMSTRFPWIGCFLIVV